MYKLVVSEFDGVLIDSEEAIGLSTIMLIDKIRSAGTLFCISSDRAINDIISYNSDFFFIDYIIGGGGAFLYDVAKCKFLYKKNITKVILKKILTNFSSYKIYGFNENGKFLVNNDIEQKIYQLQIVCNSKKVLHTLCDMLEKLKLNINYWANICDDLFCINIIMGTVDKCYAINKLCKLKSIVIDEVVAIGVSQQDIEMIKLVGCGICMKNSDRSLKKIANTITDTNDNNGVKKILNQLFN